MTNICCSGFLNEKIIFLCEFWTVSQTKQVFENVT